MSTPCLNENEIVAFLGGGLDEQSLNRVESHADACASCRSLLSAAVRDPAQKTHGPVAVRSLTEGQLVAGRHQIVRFIAAGGMGEVYEVEDTVLSTRVALKTVRPERTDDPDALDRLRRELTLARQVTHPNVSRVYDVGLHSDGLEQIPFFTLELLSGETLAERLAREGRLSVAQAKPLLEQIAAGLDAAHAVGVLHRDLKSHNVFLRKTTAGNVEAVLTDFGLARSSRENSAHPTGSGIVIGTPAYMAPEQVSGETVGPAADVYAFGVVAYEMVTGTLPFRAATPIATAALRLAGAAPDPRSVVADLPEPWSRFLGGLLQRDPSSRPTSATAALALLSAPAAPKPSLRRNVRWAAAIAVLGTVLAGAYFLRPAPQPQPSAAHVEGGKRRALAVLTLKSASAEADTAWLSHAAAQMLSAELTASPELRAVSAEQLRQTEADVSLQNSSELSAAQLDTLRKSLDLDLVLAGSVTIVGQGDDRPVRLDLRLYDAALGTQVALVTENGTERTLFESIGRAGSRLREALQAQPPSKDDSVAARAQLPQSLETARAFAEGERALHRLDLPLARARLEQVVALEPQFAPGHAALAQTLMSLGYRDEASPIAKRAVELSTALPRDQQLTIEALHASTRREWPRAIELYRSLWTVFPDDLEHGLRLATAQQAAGSSKEALATLDRLRALPGPEHEDPRIELVAAWAWSRLPDFPASRNAAARAAAQAEVRGARMLRARAKLAEAEALNFMSKRDEALVLLEEADLIFQAVGDRSSEAKAKTIKGHLARDRGDLDTALTRYREAEAIQRAQGDELNLATSLAAQAVAWRRKSNPQEALALNQQALKLFEKHSSKQNACTTINNIGRTYEDLNEPEKAAQHYEEAIARATELGETGIRVRALGSLGLLAADRGDLAKGRQAFESILNGIQSTGDPSLEASALEMLIGLHLQQGELAGAQALLERRAALSVKHKLEDEVQLSVARAHLAHHQGDFEQAERLAREAANAFQQRKASADELETRVGLLNVLLVRGDAAGSRKELARLQELASAAGPKSLAALDHARMSARFEAELGDAKAGSGQLEALLKDSGLKVATQYELTLSLARAEARLKRKAAAVARLARLTDDAKLHGFGAVVANANALSRQLGARPGP